MSLDLTEDNSTLVQVMAWCRQATSHYLSQCWPRSVSPYGVIRPQWVKMRPHLLHEMEPVWGVVYRKAMKSMAHFNIKKIFPCIGISMKKKNRHRMGLSCCLCWASLEVTWEWWASIHLFVHPSGLLNNHCKKKDKKKTNHPIHDKLVFIMGIPVLLR